MGQRGSDLIQAVWIEFFQRLPNQHMQGTPVHSEQRIIGGFLHQGMPEQVFQLWLKLRRYHQPGFFQGRQRLIKFHVNAFVTADIKSSRRAGSGKVAANSWTVASAWAKAASASGCWPRAR